MRKSVTPVVKVTAKGAVRVSVAGLCRYRPGQRSRLMGQSEQGLTTRVDPSPSGVALLAVAAEALREVVQVPAGQRDRGG